MRYLERKINPVLKVNSHLRTREENVKLLYDLINAHGVITRAELARITRISPSTVSSMVDDLLHEGLAQEIGLACMPTGAGRRPTMLSINPAGRQIPVFSFSRWGVSYTLFDLGYNVIEQSFRPHVSDNYAGQMDWADYEKNCRAGVDYANIVEDILMRQSEKFDRSRAVAVLISYPGVYIEDESVFLLSAMGVFFYKRTIDELEQRLGLPVYMGNSSMNLAYAEKKYLESQGIAVDNLIYVNICDGVGAGMICNGEMFTTTGRNTGEIGHITVEIGGRRCPCGNCGCLEQYVNVNAIIDTVRRAVIEHADGPAAVELRGLLEDATLEKIGSAYDAGLAPVREAMDDIAEKLFTGIYCTVSITGIKYLVIGGLERMGSGFLEKLRSMLGGACGKVLMRGVTLAYSQTGVYADSEGIAQYYIDKVFKIRNL